MNIPVEQWYEAILTRRSRRSFNSILISDELFMHLQNFSKQLNQVHKTVRVEVVKKNPDIVFKGIIGSYGKVKGAQAYVAFIGKVEDPNMQEKLGYIGESFILEATANGLATCWVGGFFKPEEVKKQIELSADEEVIAITPIGYSDQTYNNEENSMSALVTSHKRKKASALILDKNAEDLPKWIETAINAARLAPSAVNRQPWRFSVGNNSVKILVNSNKDSYSISKRLDCGIAMLHLEVGSLKAGVKGEWRYLESPEVAEFFTLNEVLKSI